MRRCASIAFLCISFAVTTAHGDILDRTATSVAEGLKQFREDHPEHVEHFQGVKAWADGDDIKRRVYLPENESMTYTCMQHGQGDNPAVQCHMAEH
jgi:hypothetical protein